MILVVDNYDSFTHNLARYLREEGGATRIVRNDEVDADAALDPDVRALVISPGPGAPVDAGVCLGMLARLADVRPDLPVFGVCLGHQCLVESFGGRTERALRPLHGEASSIAHDGAGVFFGISSPTSAGRYHSLIAIPPEASSGLVACAWSEEGEVMAVRGVARPLHGVQFHPESILTAQGRAMVRNFISLYR